MKFFKIGQIQNTVRPRGTQTSLGHDFEKVENFSRDTILGHEPLCKSCKVSSNVWGFSKGEKVIRVIVIA